MHRCGWCGRARTLSAVLLTCTSSLVSFTSGGLPSTGYFFFPLFLCCSAWDVLRRLRPLSSSIRCGSLFLFGSPAALLSSLACLRCSFLEWGRRGTDISTLFGRQATSSGRSSGHHASSLRSPPLPWLPSAYQDLTPCVHLPLNGVAIQLLCCAVLFYFSLHRLSSSYGWQLPNHDVAKSVSRATLLYAKHLHWPACYSSLLDHHAPFATCSGRC